MIHVDVAVSSTVIKAGRIGIILLSAIAVNARIIRIINLLSSRSKITIVLEIVGLKILGSRLGGVRCINGNNATKSLAVNTRR